MLPRNIDGHAFMGSQIEMKDKSKKFNIPSISGRSFRAKQAKGCGPSMSSNDISPLIGSEKVGKSSCHQDVETTTCKEKNGVLSPLNFLDTEMMSPPSSIEKITQKLTCK